MSATDMAQEDGICAQQCAVPDCGSRARLNSNLCATHQEPNSTYSSVNGSPTSNNLPRMTHFSESRVVAKKGPSRLRFPRVSRNSIKSHATPSPGPRETPKWIQIPNPPKSSDGKRKPPSGHEAEHAVHETNVQPNNTKPDSHKGQGPVPSSDLNHGSVSQGSKMTPSSNIFRPMADLSKAMSIQSLLSPEYGKEDLPSAAQSPKPTSPNLDCPGGPRNRPEPKECDMVDKAQAPGKLQSSVSTPTSPKHIQSINTVGNPISLTHAHSPLSASSQASLDSGGAADIESNVDEELLAPAGEDDRNSASINHDTSTTLENSLEPVFDSPHALQPVAQSNGSMPMSLDSSTPGKPLTRHTQAADNGSLPQSKDTPVIRSVITFARVKGETQRQQLKDNFNSDAFDALIYQQSSLRPPDGVKIPTRSPRKGTAPNQDDRLALHTNPAIHGMHRRSKAWYLKKSKEIEGRGGRKAWFGKVAERQRYLRSKEAVIAKGRQEAEMTGNIPPRRDPQPRGHKRIHDFGDVPEDELPEHVRNNPAWLKACAWHRQIRSQARSNPPPKPPPPKPSPTQPPQPKQSLQLQRHMQKAAEEARLFYQETVKEYKPCDSVYGWHP